MIVLGADIGGTNSRLALYEAKSIRMSTLFYREYPNSIFGSFDEVLERFFKETQLHPERASFAVAGVVEAHIARMTNRAWTIDSHMLRRKYSLHHVAIINDMTALASAVPLLAYEDIMVISPGDEQEDGTVAVIAPGTGLGQGFLLRRKGQYFSSGGEGGHAGFSPSEKKEIRLMNWMGSKYGFPISAEQVCSGPALEDLFAFLRQDSGAEPVPSIEAEIGGGLPLAPIIVQGATDTARLCPLCQSTIELFLAVLGGEAANLALKTFANGGLYLGGGIIPRLVGKVSFAPFVEGFHRRGKMRQMLGKIPVYAIVNPRIQLAGAAAYACSL